jgi:anthranilate synthase component 1
VEQAHSNATNRRDTKTNRNFYGGAIGFMDFEGNFNHAIMIRTFLSKTTNYTLKQVQIVAGSDEESEMKKCMHKPVR